MKTRILTAIAILAVAGTAGIYLARSSASAPDWIDPLDAGLVAEGKPLYAQHCAECHGDHLQGEMPEWRSLKDDGTLPAPPHDAGGHTWHHPDKVLFDYTRTGGAAIAPPGFKSAMPAFEDTLSDDEIVAVLAYIKSKWPPEQRRHQKRVDTAERESRG